MHDCRHMSHINQQNQKRIQIHFRPVKDSPLTIQKLSLNRKQEVESLPAKVTSTASGLVLKHKEHGEQDDEISEERKKD